MTDTPDSVKKGQLLTFFKEAIQAELDLDQTRMTAAYDTVRQQGITDADLEWLENTVTSPASIAEAFGENALDENLVARMKEADGMAVTFGWPRKFKDFYPN